MKRLLALSILCAAALLARANAVTEWSAIAERVATDKRSPAASELILALTHAAMHDAVAVTAGGMRPILAPGAEPSGDDAEVAAAVAAHGVLRARVPAHAAALDGELAAWLQRRGDGARLRSGEIAGREVARAVLENRANDGADAKVEWRARDDVRAWTPTAATPPVDMALGAVKPIAARDLARLRPAPPATEGEAYLRDLAEVRKVGRKDPAARTAQQTQTAMFWSDHTGVQWSRTLRELAEERKLDTRESARMLAMAHVAAADALIACFEAKYHYAAWRPIHAIRGAPAEGEGAWESLLSVNHPEYPSAHACFTGAMTEALARYFGTRRVPITVTSTTTKTARRYESLDDVCNDVNDARVFSGLHFRQSMVAGTRLGAEVAAAALAAMR